MPLQDERKNMNKIRRNWAKLEKIWVNSVMKDIGHIVVCQRTNFCFAKLLLAVSKRCLASWDLRYLDTRFGQTLLTVIIYFRWAKKTFFFLVMTAWKSLNRLTWIQWIRPNGQRCVYLADFKDRKYSLLWKKEHTVYCEKSLKVTFPTVYKNIWIFMYF